MSKTWARRDDLQSPVVMQAAHAGLTVKLITTPIEEVMTCHAAERVAEVIARNTALFDYLPVKDAPDDAGRIVGLFHAAEFFGAVAPDGRVADHVIGLTESHVIGGDAGILDFVGDADIKPCRLVFSGARISGLVSLSDLQRLPVRAALFAVITGLEMTMADAIRRRHSADDAWLACLSENRRGKIEAEMAKSRQGDGFVDSLLFTQFCDKAEIVRESISLPIGKKELKSRLGRLERLRNSIAHANEYAATREAAATVSRDIRDLLKIQKMIAAADGVVGPAA